MKTTSLENGINTDDDDMFGSNRSYESSFCSKPRPTMISAKYRMKEERRKVLKISINKLKKIEDPESSLRRSVLINNTMKRLQKEAREEKLMKQVQTFPRCYTPYKSNSIFAKDESITDVLCDTLSSKADTDSLLLSDSSIVNNNSVILEDKVDDSLSKEETTPDFTMVCTETLNDFVDVTESCDKEIESITSVVNENSGLIQETSNNIVSDCAVAMAAGQKRPFEEVEDCDVQDVLSQFYMPPTPRMLTSIDDTDDEDEDVNVVDIDIGTQEIPVVDANSSHQEISTNTSFSLSAKRPRLDVSCEELNVPSARCDRLQMCDVSSEPSTNHNSNLFASTSNDEDTEDVEVVLEDKEDIERRLMLCSGGTTITRTPVEDPCWVNSRTNTNKPPCTVQSSPSDVLVSDTNHTPHLRFGATSIIDKSTTNPYCAMNTNSNVPPVTLEHTEQPHSYSCGHSSIFSELQSVVFHSLIASLES